MRGWIVILVAVLAASCTPGQTSETTIDPAEVVDEQLIAVAQDLCPLMWRWQLDIGRIANQMSASTIDEPDLEVRRTIMVDAVGEMRARNDALAADVRSVGPGPYSGLLISDVLEGLARSADVLDELEEVARASVDPPRTIMASLFHQVEKAIDLPKPELATYRDEGMIDAFRTVPHCQFGVKDVDDGIPRFIPEE